MKNVKLTTYMPPEFKNIMLECDDIITTSDDLVPGDNTNNGYVEDDNIDNDWQKNSYNLNLNI